MPGFPNTPRTCERCGAAFMAFSNAVKIGKARHCSKSCASARGAHSLDDLIARVEYDTNGGCWLWTGSVRRHGYGAVRHGRTPASAHRVAYELSNGVALTADQHVLHKCDVPACINPHHLILGTRADNMADMAAKGRARNQWTGAA